MGGAVGIGSAGQRLRRFSEIVPYIESESNIFCGVFFIL
jgi:hypothetical protein